MIKIRNKFIKPQHAEPIVLFLTSENEILGIIYNSIRDRQNFQKFTQKICSKIFLNREFSIEKKQGRELINFS